MCCLKSFTMDIWTIICMISLSLIKLTAGHIFTHTWAANIKGGEELAQSLAEKHGFIYLGKIFDDHYGFIHPRVAKRSVVPSTLHHSKLKNEPRVKWLEQQKQLRRSKRDVEDSFNFNDPKWPKMWYLNRGNGLDMNVEAAWRQGFKGKGVVVTIMDDGLEKDHPDLEHNYDPEASFDVNSNDFDPQPRYDFTNMNRHGTRCAGVVAAGADNAICGTGVAFEANIGGIRMLDGAVTDLVESRSLGYKQEYIDIYCGSWGPDDDGKTTDGPGRLTKHVIVQGIRRGRGGKGSIFVWSSGNGGRAKDWCGCDGYANSIYTLSISSASEAGSIPWYSEGCPSTLASTYSSGSASERQVITTDLRKGCTEFHTGTSASTPMAAGIIALALSANPSLTWRDVQHIVVLTARSHNLSSQDWIENGVGRKVSHYFGFGLMDAGAMVSLARNWTTVPEQRRCEIQPDQWRYPAIIDANSKKSFTLRSSCEHIYTEINFLEHVETVITLHSSQRGKISIYLTSPQGTSSTLLNQRPRDTDENGFGSWPFMTTHNWGESPQGIWTLEIENEASYTARLIKWSLVFYGTSSNPYSTMPDSTTEQPTTKLMPDPTTTTKLTEPTVAFLMRNATNAENPKIPHWNVILIIGVVVLVPLGVIALSAFL